MPQLQQHQSDELQGQGSRPAPGVFVKHREDDRSFGTVVARVGEECSVLWSKSPHIIQVVSTPINAQSRKLSAKWSSELADDLRAMHGISGRSSVFTAKQPQFEVEEEYEYMGYDEVQRLHQDGANVQLHHDGRVTVKRRTDTPPTEDDVGLGRVRSRRVSFGRY